MLRPVRVTPCVNQTTAMSLKPRFDNDLRLDYFPIGSFTVAPDGRCLLSLHISNSTKLVICTVPAAVSDVQKMPLPFLLLKFNLVAVFSNKPGHIALSFQTRIQRPF